MNIRQAVAEDAFDIAKVQVDSWRTTYQGIVPEDFLYNQMTYASREQRWQEILEDGQPIYVADHPDAGIVGYSMGGKERTGRYENYSGELYTIYILEGFQKQGIGKRLIQPVVEQLQEEAFYSMIVWVFADNSSTRFYENIGGHAIDSVMVEVGGAELKLTAYGWTDLKDITMFQ